MTKIPFVSKEKVEEIAAKYPTPFHLYDEKGIRKNVENLKKAFLYSFFVTIINKTAPKPYIGHIEPYKKPLFTKCPCTNIA